MRKTFVYAGPTISKKSILEILPEATCMPPVRCGDIFHVMRQKPKLIVIIDGYFESTASVWHKELLYALSKGVHIIGASSMGAMRAAELAPFGMIGIGKAFEYYRDEIISDDDEVALLHLGEDHHYQPVSDAMITIRVTLAKAVKQHITSENEATAIINAAKQCHFHQRILRHIIPQVIQDKAKQTLLLNWIEHHAINQKREDAVEALTFVSKRFDTLRRPDCHYISTLYARLLQQKINAKSPMQVSTPLDTATKRLVRALSLIHTIASKDSKTVNHTTKWIKTAAPSRAIHCIDQFLEKHLTGKEDKLLTMQANLRTFQSTQDQELSTTDLYFSYCWCCISDLATQAGLTLSEKSLKQSTLQFQKQKGITRLSDWLIERNISPEAFSQFITQSLQFDLLIKHYQVDCIGGFNASDDHDWLKEIEQLQLT
jgi:hypothetical protein